LIKYLNHFLDKKHMMVDEQTILPITKPFHPAKGTIEEFRALSASLFPDRPSTVENHWNGGLRTCPCEACKRYFET